MNTLTPLADCAPLRISLVAPSPLVTNCTPGTISTNARKSRDGASGSGDLNLVRARRQARQRVVALRVSLDPAREARCSVARAHRRGGKGLLACQDLAAQRRTRRL